MERPVGKLSSTLVQPNVKFIGKRGQPAKSPERSDRSSEINWSLEKISLKELYSVRVHAKQCSEFFDYWSQKVCVLSFQVIKLSFFSNYEMIKRPYASAWYVHLPTKKNFVFCNNWWNILHIWLSPYLKFLFNDQFIRLDDQHTTTWNSFHLKLCCVEFYQVSYTETKLNN